jgi:hypothetical protein
VFPHATDTQNQISLTNSADGEKRKRKNARMAEGMRIEQFSPHNGNGALPRDDLRKLDNGGTRDLRPQTEHGA